MLREETINEALVFFQENDYPSLFSVVERKNFYFDKDCKLVTPFLDDKKYIPMLETKLVGSIYEAAHSIYIWHADRIRNESIRWSMTKNDPFLFEIPPEEAFDVDYPWQFELAEYAYIKRYGEVQP